jgi:hypothetical protein
MDVEGVGSNDPESIKKHSLDDGQFALIENSIPQCPFVRC